MVRKISLALLFLMGCTALAVAKPLYLQARVMPPKEFDKPYAGKVVVVRAKDSAEVSAACAGLKFTGTLLGCAAITKDGVCIITIVPDSVLIDAGAPYELLMRHEIGHCNGWPADHPGVRTIEEAIASELPFHGGGRGTDWTANRAP